MSVRIESFEPPSAGARWALPLIGGVSIDLDLAFEMGKDGSSYLRKVLVTSERGGKSFYRGALEWDAIFVVRETVDATLALTYLANIGKGCACVLEGQLPEVLIGRVLQMNRSHGHTILWICSPSALMTHDVDGIFFPLTYPETKESHEVVEILKAKMGAGRVQEMDIGTILKEMRASRALLQWSKWGEPSNIGSLYWNYEGVTKKLDMESVRRAVLGIFSA